MALIRSVLRLGGVAAGVGFCAALSMAVLGARQNASAVRVDPDDIGGVVTGAKGPEAGVWVIAETTDLPTKFARIVVTDDRGRYLLPDLPTANYSIWVRGYGLVDSPKTQAAPGRVLNLIAVPAPDAKAAAEYYPANYWYALMQPPPKSDFPGTGAAGNGIPENQKSQQQWIGDAKMTFACTQCHQMGNSFTRRISPSLGTFASSVDAWRHRVNVGQSGSSMLGRVKVLGEQRALTIFADWSDRIAKGELPQVPPRPRGRERSVVVTMWDWADEKSFVHDAIATDKRTPTLNANGPIYGVQELSGDWLTILDPIRHESTRIAVPLHDAKAQSAVAQTMPNPSPVWGAEILWSPKVVAHNPMMDSQGRVWTTARGGCRVYDPKTKQWKIAGGCEATHHLQFGYDEAETLWSNSPVAYFKTKVWDAAREGPEPGGRVPLVLDVNRNGKQDPDPVKGNEPADPARDKTLQTAFLYAVIPSPTDGSIWLAEMATPGSILRVTPGPTPATTALTEYYQPPFNHPKSKTSAYLPHGIDIDRNGVVWVSLTGSGHLGSFDRRKCKAPLNGMEAATGQHCPEGWTLYQAPGPNFKGVTDAGSADSFYYNWVDQFDTLGLGTNVPLLNGSGSDSLLALVNGEFLTMRVPYPMGFHSRGMDGRIDDPKTGWKGRGLWATYGAQATWHIEGGRGTRPKALHFQMRPDPLAK